MHALAALLQCARKKFLSYRGYRTKMRRGDKKLNMEPEVVDCFSFNCQLDLNVLSEQKGTN